MLDRLRASAIAAEVMVVPDQILARIAVGTGDGPTQTSLLPPAS